MVTARTFDIAFVSAPTTDPAGAYSADATAPTLAAAGAYRATFASAEIVDPARMHAAAGATWPTPDPAGRYNGPGASAPPAAGAYIPVAQATFAATEFLSPAGTYAPPGATQPIADPGGAYSAAGATEPTTDPAGAYTSPYALTRLFIEGRNTTPANAILSFSSATAVANYYGASSKEAGLATEFFHDYGSAATMLFTRLNRKRRPHLLGANISDLTLHQLQSISGSIAITFQGYTYSGLVNLKGVQSFAAAAKAIRNALNSHLQVAAVTEGSSITPVSVTFTGSVNGVYLQVTSISLGSMEPGARISGPGMRAGDQIVAQLSGTPGGAGVYSLFQGAGTIASETMTEAYGILTVGAVMSGTVAVGQEVTGAGVLPVTAIDGHLGGSGPGSTWIVNNAQTVTGGVTMTATPLSVILNWGNKPIIGETENNDFFDVSPNLNFPYDNIPSSISYASGTVASELGLTQGSGAIDSSPGGQNPTAAQFMTNLVETEDSQFGSFQAILGQGSRGGALLDNLEAWAQASDLYRFLSGYAANTPPAGSSAPARDPAGTYSAAGASAPTPAAPGTYIPVTGAKSAAAEIVDPAGSYSLSGASAPTLAQSGYYVPTTGASSETPDDPGYYTPYAGATAELLALPPTVSGTRAGQSTPAGQPDSPFSSATIADPNIDVRDTLSIQVTGGGGALSDGAGFDGLTVNASGVYSLSGTAAQITSELEALVFTPNTYSATTTFTLTATTSLATSATDANTTVTVTNGEPVIVSVSTFLANRASLNKTVGGFDVLDTAADITANLDQLGDTHIDAITISDNGQVGASIQQLPTDSRATHELQNADASKALLAIEDTAADIETGLSTLITYRHEIGSIVASDGTVVVSAATFLADRPVLDKIVSGYAISDSANDVEANLDQLNDRQISAITISDNGQITVSVAQLRTDATAIGNLGNANTSPVRLAIKDTAGAVQTGLSTLAADIAEIGSIATSYEPVFVSVATFLADRSALDKIVGGFDVVDAVDSLVAVLSTIDADSHVDTITADIDDATLSDGARVNAPNFSESGYGTSLTISEALAYGGVFSQGVGSMTEITAGDSLSLMGTASLSGATSGTGTLALAGGSATIGAGATISVSQWAISGAGTDVSLDENLSDPGSFSEAADDTFVLSGGYLLLRGTASFAGGTVDGSNVLYTEGSTKVSGLTIGGTVEWENTNALTESGGSATIGDAGGDEAFLQNTPKATYDILDNSGVGLGASTASYIDNAGLFEKTGGAGVSAIAPAVTNTGTIEVASGTLDMQEEVTGKGSDEIAGASTLEFDSRVAGQTVSFTGSGGTLNLTAPHGFAGEISGLESGASDSIAVAGPWVFSGFTENAAGTQGALGFANGASTISLTVLGDYNPAGFTQRTLANGSTLLTYA